MEKAQKGSALLTTLIVGSLLFLAISVLAGTASGTTGLIQRLERRTEAMNLAESALSCAVSHVTADSRWRGDITLTLPGCDESARGCLTFDPSTSAWSTNNFEGDSAVPGWNGRSVPAHAVHLVATGWSRNVHRRYEAMLLRPAFPYVLASQGPILSTGAVTVGALDATSQENAMVVDPQQLHPAHILSNAATANAIQLGPKSLILGDARSGGGILLDPSARVLGQTLLNRTPLEIPKIDLDQYDPTYLNLPIQGLPALIQGQTLAGVCKAKSGLFVQGDLTLDGCVLYVQGDLQIQGAIQGVGVIVVRGNTYVAGAATLASTSHAVLLAQGNVTLNGTSSVLSTFEGTVYTEGSFTANQIAVVGAYISRGADGKTTLSQVNFVQDGGMTQLEIGGSSPLLNLTVGLQGPGRTTRFLTLQVSQAALSAARPLYRIYEPETREVEFARTEGQVRARVHKVARKYGQSLGWGNGVAVRWDEETREHLQQNLKLLSSHYTRAQAGLQSSVSFDLSRFVSPAAQTHLVLWKECP